MSDAIQEELSDKLAEILIREVRKFIVVNAAVIIPIAIHVTVAGAMCIIADIFKTISKNDKELVMCSEQLALATNLIFDTLYNLKRMQETND